MSDIGTALGTNLGAYPPTPKPRPNPVVPPAAPVSTPAQSAPPQTSAQMLPDVRQSIQDVSQGEQAQSALEAEAQRRHATEAAGRAQYLQDIHKDEEQQLRGLDQGLFQPKQDDLASMAGLFMMTGMIGAFLGGKGATSAAANAQAALTGMIQGTIKGQDDVVRQQKAIYDENSAYLRDKADKVREIFKEYEEDALKFGVPTAQGQLEMRLATEADAAVLQQKVKNQGAVSTEKARMDLYKLQVQQEEKDAALKEAWARSEEAHQDRMAALAVRQQTAGQFTPEMGGLMAALAERGVSLPTGLRSRQQQASLYEGLLARHPDKSPDEIADLIKSGQIDLKAELKETQTAAGIAGRVAVATEEMAPMGDLVLQAAAKVPRTSFMPINKLLRTGQEQLLDPNLRDLKIKVNSLLNAYDVLAARGGTDVTKREAAHKLLTDADNLEALRAGVKAFAQEGEVAKQAAYRAEHKYAPGGGGPKDGDTSVSKSGKPIVFRSGQWVYQ